MLLQSTDRIIQALEILMRSSGPAGRGLATVNAALCLVSETTIAPPPAALTRPRQAAGSRSADGDAR